MLHILKDSIWVRPTL